MQKIFVTGTDTGIGKTYIAVGFLKKFNQYGLKTLGLKPLATGCQRNLNKLYNDDALQLKLYSSIQLPYEYINPIALEPAIAPHIAASQMQIKLDVETMQKKMAVAFSTPADVLVMEGIGGWYVPLNEEQTFADFVSNEDFSVVLVVGIKLGCLNHAILSYQAIKNSGLKFLGWVANCLEPRTEKVNAQISTLRKWLRTECLGIISYKGKPENELAECTAANHQKIKLAPFFN